MKFLFASVKHLPRKFWLNAFIQFEQWEHEHDRKDEDDPGSIWDRDGDFWKE
jgi:hypothetical protein